MTWSHNYVMNEKMTRACWDVKRGAFSIRFIAPKDDPTVYPDTAFTTWTLWFSQTEWEDHLTVWGEPFTVLPQPGTKNKVPAGARVWLPATDTVEEWLKLSYTTQVERVRTAMQDGLRVRPWTLGSVQAMIEEAEAREQYAKGSVGVAKVAGPRKPVPALPAESNTLFSLKPFDPHCAWKATRIAAGDPAKE